MQRPCILYLDVPSRCDNHLRNLAGIRRYALTRGWDVRTFAREETTPAAASVRSDELRVFRNLQYLK